MHSPRRFTLGGTLDEYGDIRSRPHSEAHTRNSMTTEPQTGVNQYGQRQIQTPHTIDGQSSIFSRDHGVLGHHDFETDMFQWPFIDASWSAGFDVGLDGLWHNSGLFDPNHSLK